MNPPAHVCRALYEKFPNLRLAWHGQWGKFCLVRLSPKRMTQVHSSAFRMFSTNWELQDIVNKNGTMETIASSRGPVFNKHGVGSPDWDVGMTDIFLAEKIDNIYDVFSGRVVRDLVHESVREQLRNQAKAELEKGKELKNEVHVREEQTVDKIRYYTNRHDGITINTAKKHLDAAEKQRKIGKPPASERGLQYYHVDKRGLGKYLDE